MLDVEFNTKNEFLEEACELLAAAEKVFMNMEKNPDDRSLLDQIFRLAHTLKGSGKAAGFSGIANLSHALENLLVKLRVGKIGVTSEIVDVLLRSNDALCDYVAVLRENYDAILDTKDVEDALHRALGDDDHNSASVKPPSRADSVAMDGLHLFPPNPADAHQSIVSGLHLFDEEENAPQEGLEPGGVVRVASCVDAELAATIGVALSELGSYRVQRSPLSDPIDSETVLIVVATSTLIEPGILDAAVAGPAILSVGIPATGNQWFQLIENGVCWILPEQADKRTIYDACSHVLKQSHLRISFQEMTRLCAEVRQNVTRALIDSGYVNRTANDGSRQQTADRLDKMARLVQRWRKWA